MKNKIIYLDDLGWIPNSDDEIEKMIEKYNELRKDKRKSKYSVSLENGEIAEVDFENDPDWALLLEYQDEFYDPMEIIFLIKRSLRTGNILIKQVMILNFILTKQSIF